MSSGPEETLEPVCRRRATCRLCDSRDLEQVLSLTPSPPANSFVAHSGLGRRQPVFPLDVWFCRDCCHVQLLDVVDPALLFRDYVYVSGTSPVFVSHFEDYARDILDRFLVRPNGLVVDIGSNDGTLLRCFKRGGHRTLGVDPAVDIARRATEAGIETIPGFFTAELAKDIRRRYGAADVVTANNVLAHVDDLAQLVQGIRHLLAPDGILAFEVSYLVDVFESSLFDTIYHEHLDYHSVLPLLPFFGRHGLQLIEARRVSSHGGSLRGIVQHAGGPHSVAEGIEGLAALEHELALDRPETMRAFGQRVDDLGRQLLALLRGLKADGRRIAGFGAPAKATTLMHHFGIGPELLDFIVDDSPFKQGLYTPGFHIPVLPTAALYERAPDYVLLLAWNFAESIAARHRRFTDLGGHFIVALPKPEIW